MKLGYKILYNSVRLPYYGYFKRAFYSVAKEIPKDKPVLLACNHPNSFLDGFIFASFQRQDIHFMARGDAMNTPLKKRFFGSFHAIPIYRIQEGIENLHLNKKTFEDCEELLKDNAKIIIFSEGICVHEKRVRKLKKGTARLFFQIEENNNFDMDIQVIPVGINYTYFQQPGAEILINVGEPMDTSTYINQYKDNRAKAINSFTNDLEAKIKEQVIAIDKKDDEPLVEKLLVIGRNNYKPNQPFTWKIQNKDRFNIEKKISDVINDMSAHRRDDYEKINQHTKNYFETLQTHKLTDQDISQKSKISFGKWLVVLLGWPLCLAGKILNFIPAKSAHLLARKLVTNGVFYTSVLVVAFYVTYLLLQLPMLLAVGFIFNFKIAGILLALTFIGGYFAVYYSNLWKKAIGRLRFLRTKSKSPKLIESLKTMRGTIWSKIKNYKFTSQPEESLVNSVQRKFNTAD